MRMTGHKKLAYGYVQAEKYIILSRMPIIFI